MDYLQTIIEQCKQNGDDVWISGSVDEAAVSLLESHLNITLPNDVKTFILTYGSICFHDFCISGIVNADPIAMEGGNIYADTAFIKEDFPSLSDDFIVISPHEDGAFCLSANDNYSVVNFENGHSTKVANNFKQFISQRVG